MGPAWECPPERLANGRIIYRCLYGHFHSYAGAAWSCGGPSERHGEDVDDYSMCICGREAGHSSTEP